MKRLVEIYYRIFPLKIMKYHNFRVIQFVKDIAKKYDDASKKLLDVGAENSPYKKYFEKSAYFSQDITQNKEFTVDFIGDISKKIPEIENESFDYILCTQVLEHVTNPMMAFVEFHRILKRGGRLFLTTHMCYDEHMVPNDYFRFTKYGLRHLGKVNGFDIEHIAPHGGIFQVIARITNTLPIKLFFGRDTFLYYAYIFIFTIPMFVFNLLCFALDFLDREKAMTLNYECIYRKK